MLVKAKCVAVAWDSVNATRYEPGAGPLPGGLYEIDRDGPLASLKLGSTYVFEFDRNANPDDKPHDYSCKKPGCVAHFKTLAALGSHTRSAHKDESTPNDEPPENPEDDEPKEAIVKDGRGKKKGKTFTCKQCGEVLPHLYALKVHKKSHEEAAVTQAA